MRSKTTKSVSNLRLDSSTFHLPFIYVCLFSPPSPPPHAPPHHELFIVTRRSFYLCSGDGGEQDATDDDDDDGGRTIHGGVGGSNDWMNAVDRAPPVLYRPVGSWSSPECLIAEHAAYRIRRDTGRHLSTRLSTAKFFQITCAGSILFDPRSSGKNRAAHIRQDRVLRWPRFCAPGIETENETGTFSMNEKELGCCTVQNRTKNTQKRPQKASVFPRARKKSSRTDRRRVH